MARFAPLQAQKYIINPGLAFNPYDEYIADEFEHIQENATIGMETLIDKLQEMK